MTVDGRNPKQPPEIDKTMQIMVDSPYQLVLAGFLPSTVVIYDSYPITTKVMNLLGFLEWHISFTTGDFRPLPWHQPYIMAPLTNLHQYPHHKKQGDFSGLFATSVPFLKQKKKPPLFLLGVFWPGGHEFSSTKPSRHSWLTHHHGSVPREVTSVSGCSNTKSAWLPTIKTKASVIGDRWSNQGTGPRWVHQL